MDEMTQKNSPDHFAKFVFFTILLGVIAFAAVSYFFTGIVQN